MGFSTKQVRSLRQSLNPRHIRQREHKGRTFSYVESWHAISEANRIFGFAGWDRETIEARNLVNREAKGSYLAVYLAKVRVTVRARDSLVVREGHGTGEGRGASPGEAHDLALKAAETDATKRALVTFGHPFGLGLYLGERPELKAEPVRIAQDPAVSSVEAIQPEQDGPIQSSEPIREKGGVVAALSAEIDKSVLPFGPPRRLRDRDHLRFVASQPCLLCGRAPSDAHHLRFAQPAALGRKVSDEFTVPLCRTHHRQLHQSGNELVWWQDLDIDPLVVAKELWQESRLPQREPSVAAKVSHDRTRVS